MNYYLSKFFENSENTKKIFFISKIFLFFLILDFDHFFKNSKFLIFSCLINSIKYFFSGIIFKEKNYFDKKNFFCNEKKIVMNFLKFFKLDFFVLKIYLKFVKDYLKNFEIDNEKIFFEKIEFEINFKYLM